MNSARFKVNVKGLIVARDKKQIIISNSYLDERLKVRADKTRLVVIHTKGSRSDMIELKNMPIDPDNKDRLHVIDGVMVRREDNQTLEVSNCLNPECAFLVRATGFGGLELTTVDTRSKFELLREVEQILSMD